MEIASLRHLLCRPTTSEDSLSSPSTKHADTVPSVHELIKERWSPRSFEPRDISDADLQAILEAGRWAASSYNEQPWRFVVARRSETDVFAKLLNILIPFNQTWAKNASALVFTFAKKTFTQNGKENLYGLHDTGAAGAQMLLQANALGLEGHGMAGFDRERTRTELSVPDDFEIGAVFAFGYPAPPEKLALDEKMIEAERGKRQRKPLNELAFSGIFGSPLNLNS